MAIHQKLKKLRQNKNLSQLAVADKLHISQSAYSLIESGKTKIDEQRILQFAKILDVHPSELINDDTTSLRNNKYKNGDVSDIQILNSDKNELVKLLCAQLEKKDDQIEKLLLQIDRLSTPPPLKKLAIN